MNRGMPTEYSSTKIIKTKKKLFSVFMSGTT